MAKTTREVTIYECDRCGFKADAEAIVRDEARLCGPSSLRFLVVQTRRDPHKVTVETWLCPSCTKGYDRFMADHIT